MQFSIYQKNMIAYLMLYLMITVFFFAAFIIIVKHYNPTDPILIETNIKKPIIKDRFMVDSAFKEGYTTKEISIYLSNKNRSQYDELFTNGFILFIALILGGTLFFLFKMLYQNHKKSN
jgi:hypothetical protein